MKEFLMVYDGGSEYSDLIANITSANLSQTEISSTRNQMFITFETSLTVTKRGFRAKIDKIGI